jgi:succinate dehydrogenase/fumarate reductase flavoprotein subunit
MCVLPLQKYCPATADLPTTNGPWATGDGIELGTGLGAALVGMEHVQVGLKSFVFLGFACSSCQVVAIRTQQ